MPQKQRFDIPRELRQFAEENVERAHQLYLQFMDHVAQTMAVWSARSSDAHTWIQRSPCADCQIRERER
jgi:hypothetical protein